MNFSDEWRSLWPISSVFSAPNLLSAISSNTFGPLHFLPNPHSRQLLLSSPSFSLQIPPPLSAYSILDGLRCFLRSPSDAAFLPHSSHLSLACQFLADADADPIGTNALCSLPLRNSSYLILFPAGENSHQIAFLLLSFAADGVRILNNGQVSTQADGFRHPSHRILRMSVVPALGYDSETTSSVENTVEGFLVASTLYSANWFRIETRVSDGRVSLVPAAKQGFESPVADVCCSLHFAEESAVLLESGVLCWFHIGSKRSGKVRVTVDGCDPGGWLRCEFGGQPWILLVACSSAVVVVDLRDKKGTKPKVLAWITDDRVIAFSRSRFNGFHVSVVTEQRLLLFDSRKPLVPILTWKHNLCGPCYVSIFRLSELRPSNDFWWASDSGYAILAGSFWNDDFRIFCYGPREGGDSGDSLLYAWELPSCVFLSGRHYGSVDSLVKEELSTSLSRRQQKDVVVGFWIVPNNLLKLESEYGGFALIRLLLSGKLEMQSYHASWEKLGEKSNGEKDMVQLKDSVICSTYQDSRTSTGYSFCKFGWLYEYLTGNLSNALVMHEPQLKNKENLQKSYDHRLKEIIRNKVEPSSHPVSEFINDVTVPTNIVEIALQRVLNCLEPNLLPLAFSERVRLFENNIEKTTFPLLEIPNCLPHHRTVHYLVGRPRAEKCPGESLVGPVLPVPVLLTLQHMEQKKNSSCLKEEPEDDILALECKNVLDICNFSAWGSSQDLQYEKFFIYEPSHTGNRYTCKGTSYEVRSAVKEEASEMDQPYLEPEPDKRFSTFVCGTAEKTGYTDNNSAGFEIFDHLSPLKLDFDSPSIMLQPREQEIFKRFTRQASQWQGNFKPYEEFLQSVEDSKVTSLK